MLRGVFSRILGPQPLDAGNAHAPRPPSSCDNPECLHILSNDPQGSKAALVENHYSRSKSDGPFEALKACV